MPVVVFIVSRDGITVCFVFVTSPPFVQCLVDMPQFQEDGERRVFVSLLHYFSM